MQAPAEVAECDLLLHGGHALPSMQVTGCWPPSTP